MTGWDLDGGEALRGGRHSPWHPRLSKREPRPRLRVRRTRLSDLGPVGLPAACLTSSALPFLSPSPPCLHLLLVLSLPPPSPSPHFNASRPLSPHLLSIPCPPLLPSCPDPSTVGTNKCRVNNGGCSSLCLATPGSRQCACAEDQVLGSDGVTCMGTRGPAGVGGRGAGAGGGGHWVW